MCSQFVTCRPSLPLGFKVGGLPPVQRPVHADEVIETYLLDRTADSDLMLVRTRDQEMGEHLREWWRILGPDVATEVSSDIHRNGITAVRLHGQWWPDKGIGTIAESQWKSLLLASLKLLKTAYEAGFYPLLKPSLIWISKQPAMLMPLYAQPQSNALQQDMLRDLATALIARSTGIDVAEITWATHSGRSWNKYIPSELFDALVRCLPDQGIAQISCFEELEDRITGKSGNSTGLLSQSHKANNKEGLSNIAGMHHLKEWLRKEVLGPLQNPEIYEKYRIGIPNGILFYGRRDAARPT